MIIILGIIWGFVPPILDRFKTKSGSCISIFAGASPFLFIQAFQGKLGIPDIPEREWIVWSLLVLSCPAYICSALLFSKFESRKARNASYVGSVIGAGVSLYTWSLLWGFGAA
jgi:uncharacterized membrane protein YeaQ/YmgE (transglycosylase-associated protein family)